MVLMCMVADIICSSSVNKTGVLFVYWLYGVFEELSQFGNNCLFGQALFIFIYFDLCKLIPIRKLLPCGLWVLSCVLLYVVIPIGQLFLFWEENQINVSLSTLSAPILFSTLRCEYSSRVSVIVAMCQGHSTPSAPGVP